MSQTLGIPTRRALLAGSGSLLAGLLASPSFAADLPVRISKSGPGTAGSLQDGLLEKNPHLTKGLKIDWIDGDPGQLQTFILSGALDSGPFGALGVAEMAAKGADIVMFGPRLNNHGSWIVRADSPYRHPADLRGKRVATQLPTSDTYRHARMAAALGKLDLRSDFEFVFGPPVANVALFGRGDVEAVIAIEPTASRLIAQGHREIARVSDQWAEATGDKTPLTLVTCAATRKWVDANPETATLVGRMTLELNRTFARNPAIVKDPAVYRPMGFQPKDAAILDLLVERLPRVYATEWNKDVFDGFDRQLEVALSLGLIDRRPRNYIRPL